MLKSDRVYLALALATAAAVGCGGSGDTVGKGGGGHGGTTSSSSSTTTSSSSSSSTGGGGGASCPTHEGTVLAVTKLSFGEGYSGQWKKIGLNVDGKSSTALSTDLCQPNAAGDTVTAYPDGEQGIDNSFGKNLLPTILGLYPSWVTDINNGIGNGLFTALVKIECLPATGDAPALTTKLFGGTTLGSKPKLDGTDKWPVEPELLADPKDPTSSTIIFDKSSVTGDVYDSGKNVTIILTVPLATATSSTSLKLTLYSGQMIMTLSPDRKSATNGMIGGVLNTEELVTEVKKVGALLGFCDNALLGNLVLQVRQASDIMSDGTQDPTKTCDGVTMGLGFEMKEAQLGDVGPSTPPGKTCP